MSGETSAEGSLKHSRKECHAARDRYLACVDEYGEQEQKRCRVELADFKNKCPASWVPHFIRKHQYERYKRDLVEKGVLSADQKYTEQR